MASKLETLKANLEAAFGGLLLSTTEAIGELTIVVKASDYINVATRLRDDRSLGFEQLVDLCGVDHPEREMRFTVVYNLLSLSHNRRIRVKLATADGTPVPSVSSVFRAAGWYEREAWDLYGIYFSDHADLPVSCLTRD